MNYLQKTKTTGQKVIQTCHSLDTQEQHLNYLEMKVQTIYLTGTTAGP